MSGGKEGAAGGIAVAAVAGAVIIPVVVVGAGFAVTYKVAEASVRVTKEVYLEVYRRVDAVVQKHIDSINQRVQDTLKQLGPSGIVKVPEKPNFEDALRAHEILMRKEIEKYENLGKFFEKRTEHVQSIEKQFHMKPIYSEENEKTKQLLQARLANIVELRQQEIDRLRKEHQHQEEGEQERISSLEAKILFICERIDDFYHDIVEKVQKDLRDKKRSLATRQSILSEYDLENKLEYIADPLTRDNLLRNLKVWFSFTTDPLFQLLPDAERECFKDRLIENRLKIEANMIDDSDFNTLETQFEDLRKRGRLEDRKSRFRNTIEATKRALGRLGYTVPKEGVIVGDYIRLTGINQGKTATIEILRPEANMNGRPPIRTYIDDSAYADSERGRELWNADGKALAEAIVSEGAYAEFKHSAIGFRGKLWRDDIERIQGEAGKDVHIEMVDESRISRNGETIDYNPGMSISAFLEEKQQQSDDEEFEDCFEEEAPDMKWIPLTEF
jgi:hypothetical protein